MRLINVQSLELEEFLGGNIPPYYILSHTWGDEEISFQEYTWLQAYKEKLAAGIIEEKPPKHRERLRAKDESLRRRSGYQKIVRFARLVPALNSKMLDSHRRTADYIWVDTCCINKESSAELSEAINSMYQWYKDAELCIAFMADVEDRKVAPQSGFGKSRWFTRGWTLQELLAPKLVLFFNKHWNYITERRRDKETIMTVTGIDDRHLTGMLPSLISPASAAEKMSWAARRQTTRLEDEAYCLMGIFGVNMPLLYGEGKKAFQRLQQEIIKQNADQSIFAWGYNRRLEIRTETLGMLARSPEDFANCGEIKFVTEPSKGFVSDAPYHITNIGLQILVELFRTTGTPSITFAILPCEVNGYVLGFPISAKEVQDGHAVSRSFGHPIALFRVADKEQWQPTIIRRTVVIRESYEFRWGSRSHYIQVKPGPDLDVLETWPECVVGQFYGLHLRCAHVDMTTFFRIRMDGRDSERRAEFVVVVVPPSRMYTLVQVRVFEWESFRAMTECDNEECHNGECGNGKRGNEECDNEECHHGVCDNDLPSSLAALFIASPEMLASAAWPTDESKAISAKIEGKTFSSIHRVHLLWNG